MSAPEGFLYRPEMISEEEETTLVAELAALPFQPFEFRGYLGNRRVVSFGWRYDFNDSKLKKAAGIPVFLSPLIERVAGFAVIAKFAIEQALITEYAPGAAIGWHKDRSVFDDVIGVSLKSACTFRFRRKQGETWERASVPLAPRSAYLLRGAARNGWEHSIPAVARLRYSITLRTMKGQ